MIRKLLSTIVVALFSLGAYAQPQGWSYNLPITINNTNSMLVNYTMPIVVNTQALIAAGHMQPNGSDIRFGTPCTGTKMYNFFIDSGINTTSTLIYVQIDTLMPNQSLIIYMYYGNPNVAPASTLGVFSGPKSMDAPLATTSTTTVGSGSYTGYNSYTFGARFKPNQNIIVTHLGRKCYTNTSYLVTLWDNSGNILAQSNVSGTQNTFDYTQLSTPIMLTAGTTYTVSVYYGTSNTGYFYAYNSSTIPLSPEITFVGGYANTGGVNTYPTSNWFGPTEFYGLADIKYYYASSVNNPPSYFIGTQNSGGITGQPSNLAVCVGNTGSFSVFSPANNSTNFWQKKQGANWINLTNGSPYSGVNSSTLTISGASLAMNGNLYRDSVSNSCGSGVSNTASINIIQSTPIIPYATVSGPNPACANLNALYTVTTNVNGASYQWMLNNTLVSTSASYAFQPNNNDHLYAIVSAPSNGNFGCYSLPTAVSNQMIITTGNNFTPVATVVANETNVCDGTQINFSLQSNVYSGNYQWHVNGQPAGQNLPGYTYIPANGDQVSCTVTVPPNGCYNLPLISSLPLAITTTPNITPVVSLNAPASVAAGSQVNLSLSILNLQANYYILWYKNGVRFDSTLTASASYTKGQGTDYIVAKLFPVSDASIGACYANVTSSQKVVANSTASVNTIGAESTVSVFPNPFSSEISVDGLQAGDRVCIYDITGRVASEVWNIENNDQQKFNINNILPGTYFLKVVNSNGNARSVITLQKL